MGLFKKRKGPRSRTRRREEDGSLDSIGAGDGEKGEEEEGEDCKEGGEEEMRMKKLAEVREEQRWRAKKRGLDAEASVGRGKGEGDAAAVNPLTLREGRGGSGAPPAAEAGDALEIAGEGSQSLSKMMENQFKSGGSGLSSSGGPTHDKYMEEYVEKTLGLRQPRSDGAHNGEHGERKRLANYTEEDRLYIIPEAMQRMVEEARRELSGGQVRPADEESTQLAWNTGIAEVELPETERRLNELRTAEALEARRRHRAHDRATFHEKMGNTSAVVGSISANYTQISADRARDLKDRFQRKESMQVGAGGRIPSVARSGEKKHSARGNNGSSSRRSNDDIAVGRFIKSMRGR